MTASSSTSCSRFGPPSNFVNGHVSTMWFMVCCWPRSQKGDWPKPHLCQLAQCGHWPVQKWFIGDHVCQPNRHLYERYWQRKAYYVNALSRQRLKDCCTSRLTEFNCSKQSKISTDNTDELSCGLRRIRHTIGHFETFPQANLFAWYGKN